MHPPKRITDNDRGILAFIQSEVSGENRSSCRVAVIVFGNNTGSCCNRDSLRYRWLASVGPRRSESTKLCILSAIEAVLFPPPELLAPARISVLASPSSKERIRVFLSPVEEVFESPLSVETVMLSFEGVEEEAQHLTAWLLQEA